MKLLVSLKRISLALMLTLAFIGIQPAMAVNPDEMLKDPKLEQRAREISAELRCLVCQNQSIDDSDAPLAKDLRILVRDRITKGDSNEEAVQFLVERYGEFVLLKPRLTIKTIILWGFGPAILILGLLAVHMLYRKNKRAAVAKAKSGTEKLSDAEQKKLDAILKQDD